MNGLLLLVWSLLVNKAMGKYLPELYAKTKENSLDIETIIGDAAYSGKDNIQLARKEKIHLVSKLNPSVSKGLP